MTSKKPLGLPSHLLIAAAAAAGILAGVAAVYVKGMGSGNGANPDAASTSASGDCDIPPAKKAAIAAAARGEVAAMTPLDNPRTLDLSFADDKGKPLTLASFAGKTVLLNLWATWCFPCRAEMPALDRLQNEAGGPDFEVVAVNIDTGSDEKPKAFLTETGIIHMTPYRDSSMGVFNSLKKEGLALGLPVSLLIDGKGCAVGAMNGPAHWDGADAKALIEAVKG